MKTRIAALLASLVLFASPSVIALSPGDCMVVGYNSAGTDAVSFVTWVELANGYSIIIADADYNGGGDGSGEGTGGGSYDYNGGSTATIEWTNNTGSPIAPGTVIVITDTSSPSANIGTTTGSFGLTNQGEHFFLVDDGGFFDGSDRLIGTLLFGVDYDGSGGSWGDAGEGLLPGALNVANGNLSFSHLDSKEFNGLRSGSPLADYADEVGNGANWGVPVGGGALLAEAFVDGGDPPEPPADELGQVSEGLLFHPRRLNGALPILDEAWMTGEGSTLTEANNFVGASCIRIPDSYPNAKRASKVVGLNTVYAKYYLYYAKHSGNFIRMAWAEDLAGPWYGYRMSSTLPLQDRGVLSLGTDDEISPGNGIVIDGHIASPQVFIDDSDADPNNWQFVMYYHGPGSHLGSSRGQNTYVATSSDGLNFNQPSEGGQVGHGTLPFALGESYFRIFEEGGNSYAFSNTGDIWSSPVAATPEIPAIPGEGYNYRRDFWDMGPNQFTAETESRGWINDPGGERDLRPRHFGVLRRDGILYAFLTHKAARPERIRVATYDFGDLSTDYNSWKADFPYQELMQAEEVWEGALFDPIVSASGSKDDGVNQLRDPGILEDVDGRTYMFYSGQGEDAIGMTQLVTRPEISGPTEVITGADHTFSVATDVDVTPSMLKISRAAEVAVDFDAEEPGFPFIYAGNGSYSVVQSGTVGQGSNSFQLGHFASGASETLTFPDRYYARPGATFEFSSRLGSATTGQVAELQISFDGSLWETIWIRVGGTAQGSFSTIPINVDGLVGRSFEMRFRYSHQPLRNGSFQSGAAAGTGWFLDEILAEGFEAVTLVSEAAFTAASFTLDDIASSMTPFINTEDDEDDRFLLCVEGLHSGPGFNELVGYGKPYVIRVRTSYEQFKSDQFTVAEQADPLISGENADPDRDGFTNLREHVFGTNPFVANGNLMTIGGSVIGGAVNPVLSFPWNPEAGFTYQLQMSTDLQEFHDILFIESTSVNGSLLDVMLELDPSVPDSGNAAFFRLNIEEL